MQLNFDMMEWSDLKFIISYVAISYKCLWNFNIAFALGQFLYFCGSAKILFLEYADLLQVLTSDF